MPYLEANPCSCRGSGCLAHNDKLTRYRPGSTGSPSYAFVEVPPAMVAANPLRLQDAAHLVERLLSFHDEAETPFINARGDRNRLRAGFLTETHPERLRLGGKARVRSRLMNLACRQDVLRVSAVYYEHTMISLYLKCSIWSGE